MPRLSKFFGITIYMYHSEPHQRPHFQARHAGKHITVAINDMTILAGKVGRGQFDATSWDRVEEWGWLHQQELFHAWDARGGRGEIAQYRPAARGTRLSRLGTVACKFATAPPRST